ncbi:tail fiber protein [Pasteurella multocida]|uniref:tail fiber protein n=1 Tax=Pasteurella multocida TaxID=747 RepID=UPI0023004A2B|nr:tail fiber protein [Pasteurella multocida]MDA5611937.1 tail fiber protein [Pasteurella multocida]
MADFNKPTVDSHYTQFPNEIKAAINAALSFLDGGSHTNIPLKAKRWNPTSKIFEEYSGTQWVPMATEYKLPVDYNALRNKPVPSSATNSDSETQFASSKAVKDAYDLADEKQSPATTLAGYGITNFKIETANGNANNYKTDGNYYFASGKNLPGVGAWHIEVVSGGAENAIRQIARKANDSEVKERFFNGSSWSEWKKTGSDGVPVGSIVAFPQEISNPQGFLLANGSTFNQQTYPDLYRTLGNKNKLPNLRRSDVGMTAYFATDAIPDGWIAFDSIRTTVTQQNYPELYQYLVDKYGAISNVPLAEDRFIRNAGNGLSVGQNQESSFEHYHGVGQIIANNDAAMIIGQWEDRSYRSIVVHGQDAYINITNATGEAEKGNQRPLRTAKENANGEVRPKSIVLKLCIKAQNTFDDVQFWIKAFGVVENAGVLDAETLAQNLQQADVKIQQLENSSKQNQQNIQQIGQQVSQVQNQLQNNAKTRKIWQGNATAGNGLLTLSESVINKSLVFYLQPSVNSTLNNNDVATLSCYVDSKLSEVQQKRFLYAVYVEGGWRNLKIEVVNDTQIKLIDSSGFYLKAITASN